MMEVLIILEVVLLFVTLLGFKHEDVLVEFEKNFPQNVKDYFGWYAKRFRKIFENRRNKV